VSTQFTISRFPAIRLQSILLRRFTEPEQYGTDSCNIQVIQAAATQSIR